MKVTCNWVIGFALIATGAAAAAALDAPQKLHHIRTAEPRQTETHRTVHHTARTAEKTTAHPAAQAHTTARGTTARSASVRTATHTTAARTAVHIRRAALNSPRYERITAPSVIPGGVGADDVTTGEDPVIRQAALDALGDLNGTAVVIDPSTGRILAMVNQKLALSPGAEPCSTIKLSVGLAALSEGLVTRDTPVNLGGFRMNMTEALQQPLLRGNGQGTRL
jgi:membrane carboxypeptidase/penicillin-binding protein